jgi:hypothetical protein
MAPRSGEGWRVLALCVALLVIPAATLVACSRGANGANGADGKTFECANDVQR